MTLHIRANYNIACDSIDLYVGETGDRGFTAIADPLVLRAHELGQRFDPTLSLQGAGAQELMDELWRCGVRPTEGRGSAGSLKATEYHLEDMRKIAFDLMGRKS